MDTLHFMVEVMAMGWIGFGFSTAMPPTTPSMTGYDVAVAMVNAAGVGNITVKYLTVLHGKVQWPMGNALYSGSSSPGSSSGRAQCVFFLGETRN